MLRHNEELGAPRGSQLGSLARTRRQRRRVATIALVVGSIAVLAVGVWLFTRRTRPRLEIAAAAVTPPTVVWRAPQPVEAQRTTVERDLAEQLGRLTIRVVDAATRAPLPAAWIALPVPLRAPDDEPMDIEVQGFAANPVTLDLHWCLPTVLAGAEGYVPAAVQSRLLPAEPEVEVIVALERAGSIELEVKSAADGRPIEGVALLARASMADDPQLGTLVMRAQRRVVLNEQQKSDRSLVFPSLPARRPASGVEPVEALSMDDGVELMQRDLVLFWLGQPLLGHPRQRYARTSGGAALYNAVPTGASWVLVFWPDGGFEHGCQSLIAVRAGEATRVSLVLRSTNEVSGRVAFEDGTPAVGAFVQVFSEDCCGKGDPDAVEMITDASGAFAIPLNRRRFLVLAGQDHGRAGEPGIGFGAWQCVDFTGNSGEQRTLDLLFSRRERDADGHVDWMRGRVRQADGSPVEGAALMAGIFGPRARSDRDGRFVLYGGIGALLYVAADVDRAEVGRILDQEISVSWNDPSRQAWWAQEPFTLESLATDNDFDIQLARR